MPIIYIFSFFLGTPPENIKSICKSNLNVIRRTAHGGGYYFSEHPQLSLGYGRGKEISNFIGNFEFYLCCFYKKKVVLDHF